MLWLQGMSDLAAPMLVVMKDEAEAFWCFAALMDRLESNFHSDSQGMHAQLSALRDLIHLLDPPLHAHLAAADALSFFFAYRWLLIHFKREFAFDEVGLPQIQAHYECLSCLRSAYRSLPTAGWPC